MQQLGGGLVIGEVASGADRAAELGVQCLDGVRRMDDPADGFGEGKERDDAFPAPPPGGRDGGVLLPPGALLEG